METSGITQRIAIMGPFGLGNLGDAAIQDVVIERFRELLPGVEVVGCSYDPEDTRNRHGIEALPINRAAMLGHMSAKRTEASNGPAAGPSVAEENRASKKKRRLGGRLRERLWLLREEVRFIRATYRSFKGTTALVFSGGGQIDDHWGGAWAYPYSMLKWVLIARKAGAKVILLAVGAGPVRQHLSRLFFHLAIRLARFRSLRDTKSLIVLNEIGIKRTDGVYSDPAFLLKKPNPVSDQNPTAPTKIYLSRVDSSEVVAIGPIPFGDPRIWPDRDKSVYEVYLTKLVEFSRDCLDRGLGVHLFGSEIYMDRVVTGEIYARLSEIVQPSALERVSRSAASSVSELLQELADCTIVVASRFHAALFGHVLEKPVIALSYHHKLNSLFDGIGQSRFCLQASDFSVEVLNRRITEAIEKKGDLVTAIQKRNRENRQELENLFETVGAILSAS